MFKISNKNVENVGENLRKDQFWSYRDYISPFLLNLCHSITELAKYLCTKLVDPSSFEEFLSCRFLLTRVKIRKEELVSD